MRLHQRRSTKTRKNSKSPGTPAVIQISVLMIGCCAFGLMFRPAYRLTNYLSTLENYTQLIQQRRWLAECTILDSHEIYFYFIYLIFSILMVLAVTNLIRRKIWFLYPQIGLGCLGILVGIFNIFSSIRTPDPRGFTYSYWVLLLLGLLFLTVVLLVFLLLLRTRHQVHNSSSSIKSLSVSSQLQTSSSFPPVSSSEIASNFSSEKSTVRESAELAVNKTYTGGILAGDATRSATLNAAKDNLLTNQVNRKSITVPSKESNSLSSHSSISTVNKSRMSGKLDSEEV